jgi:LysR family glycine cleavage system transcriptional activator
MWRAKHNLPLNSLRVFEAVGRHGQMRRAAEELCVTQGAVSQQVRKLESLLGVTLLHRTNTGLALTPQGARLLRDVSSALDGLVRAAERVSRNDQVAELRVVCPAGLASNWLVPRLGQFLERYRGHEFWLEPIAIYPRVIPADVDLAITYGKPPVSEERVTRLGKSQLIPVASAELVGADRSDAPDVNFILSHTLIHADDGAEWRLWLELAGAEGARSASNIYLSAGYHMIVDAVRRGLGIGLLARRFIEKDLAAGHMVVVHGGMQLEPEHYYVVRPEDAYRSATGRAFESWLYEQWDLSAENAAPLFPSMPTPRRAE